MEEKKLCEFILGCNIEDIHENVIIAPCWTPESVDITESRIVSNSTCTIYDCRLNEISFSYIISGVGACNCADIVMALHLTKCKRVLFIGSAGGLTESIDIGDIVFPQYLLSAEGASRFLNEDIAIDSFGFRFEVDRKLHEKVILKSESKAKELGISIHTGTGVSVDSIYSQFKHLPVFRNLGCDFIDMEASAFCAALIHCKLRGCVCFCISDNSSVGMPLMYLDEAVNAYRKAVRKEIVPIIIEACFE